MDTKPAKLRETVRPPAHRAEHEVVGGTMGAIAGATMGAVAGPPGIAAGAVIGGIVGAVASAVMDKSGAEKDAHDRALDAEIGVTEGELGAPNLEHPPAEIGAFSAAATGASASEDSAPAEGPIQTPES